MESAPGSVIFLNRISARFGASGVEQYESPFVVGFGGESGLREIRRERAERFRGGLKIFSFMEVDSRREEVTRGVFSA